MTSHETRSTHTTRNKGSASEQNDLKKLKSKYSAKLPTLKVLFSDWSDDDLLFVLEEANGDLDLTIDRISEGHANQWGEVKTKKSKKEAQKAKAVTTGVSSHQQQSTITPYREPKITQQQQPRSYNNNDRATRPGKVPSSSTSSRTRSTKSNVQPVSWDTQPKQQQSHHQEVGGSWASIASSKQQQQFQEEQDNDDGWNNDSTAAVVDEWAAPPTSLHNTSATTTTNDETTDDQPKTWASLLKSKPKPEIEPTTTTNTSTAQPITNTTSAENNTSEWDTPSTSNVTDGWNAPNEPIIDEWSTPVHESTPVTTTETNEEKELTEQEEPVFEEKEQEKQEESIQDTTANRLLNQEEPVVLPNTSAAISSLDVKFGSLNIDEEPIVEETAKETTTIAVEEPVAVQQPEEEQEQAPASTPAASVTPSVAATPVAATTTATAATTATTAAPISNDSFGQSYLKQEPTYNQTSSLPQQQPHQQQIPQQPHQQQQFGMDHLTSAYNSYLPNQPPTGVSGFGMNPMANLPDYGIYGTEAQRAAAMGYYDPTAFSHSPSVTSASAYQTRDKYSQDALHGQSGQNQSIPQQQMYPTNLPYYQYYYMPNQFSAYQQSAYGQPFMNKSMYPNMYQQQQQQQMHQPLQQQQQQQANKPTTATATTTNAATSNTTTMTGVSPYASPYGQQQSQLYNNHQYEDLQNQLSMGGLNDYQKSMYGSHQQHHQQLSGFLGGLNGANTSTQPQQQAQQTSQQQQNKSVTGTGNASVSTPQQQPSQQQHLPQQQQQHLPQQHLPQQQQQQYAGANYFGQPQIFSYGQYPQQQTQQQQFQQQMPPQQQSQQPTRQQQYWNQ